MLSDLRVDQQVSEDQTRRSTASSSRGRTVPFGRHRVEHQTPFPAWHYEPVLVLVPENARFTVNQLKLIPTRHGIGANHHRAVPVPGYRTRSQVPHQERSIVSWRGRHVPSAVYDMGDTDSILLAVPNGYTAIAGSAQQPSRPELLGSVTLATGRCDRTGRDIHEHQELRTGVKKHEMVGCQVDRAPQFADLSHSGIGVTSRMEERGLGQMSIGTY